MNVKRYRAANMRDALEQIKSELGEEALVLGSKQIHTNGFLGIGARDYVEVRVSTELAENETQVAPPKRQPRSRQSNFSGLNLRDSSEAVPTVAPRSPALPPALMARANAPRSQATTAADSWDSDLTYALNHVGITPESDQTALTKLRNNRNVSKELLNKDSDNQAVKRDALAVELRHLKAEIREIKFSLGRPTLSNQQAPRPIALADKVDDQQAGIYDSPFYEAYLYLTSRGIEPEMSRKAIQSTLNKTGRPDGAEELAQYALVNLLTSLIDFADPAAVSENKIIAMVGPTGVGKTTTIAKLAARATLRERRRVELISLDTYRIGAIDQLKTYADIIGAGFHVARSVLELDALVHKLSGTATLLLDTIGRSARDLADQMELADYLRTNKEITKYLVVQATTNPADSLLAIKKFAMFGTTGLVLTKLDETAQPGNAIETASQARLPLVYLCDGQRVPEDIDNATPESLASRITEYHVLAAAA